MCTLSRKDKVELGHQATQEKRLVENEQLVLAEKKIEQLTTKNDTPTAKPKKSVKKQEDLRAKIEVL